jgi:histone H3/H4
MLLGASRSHRAAAPDLPPAPPTQPPANKPANKPHRRRPAGKGLGAVEGLKNPSITRMARSLGISVIGSDMYDTLRRKVGKHVDDILRQTAIHMNNKGMKTIKPELIQQALLQVNMVFANIPLPTVRALRIESNPSRPAAIRHIDNELSENSRRVLFFAPATFKDIIEETLERLGMGRFSLGNLCVTYVQMLAEKYLESLMRSTNAIAEHSGRKKVKASDVAVVDKMLRLALRPGCAH